jgi:ABC-type multidrug transport system ATPase subunit
MWMSDEHDRIAIIGAGASGITACQVLQSRGIPFDCFEKGSGVGGLWRYENDSGMSSAYDCLHINTSREAMSYRAYPMPEDYPDYPHHTRVLSYLEDYVEHFGLRDSIRFRTAVERVECVDGEWRVRWREADGEPRTARYAAVLVASGHHWDPRWPDPELPGAFAGRELHSHDYRTAEEFAGANVLVVGIGDSAMDIASDLSRVANSTYITARRGAWIVPRYLGSAPLDQVGRRLQSRLPIAREVATGPLFALARSFFAWRVGLIQGRPQDHGLPQPDHKLGRGEVTVSSEILTRIGQGRVQPKPWIAHREGRRVHFEDGSVEKVDTIVYCTGYNLSFPFLGSRIVAPDPQGMALYRRVVDPAWPGLYFIGLVNVLGPVNPLSEMQSEWVADLLEARIGLPPRVSMRKAIAKEDRRRRRRYGSSPKYAFHVDQVPYLHVLQRERRRRANRSRARALSVLPRRSGRVNEMQGIECRELRKAYGEIQALDGVSFEVGAGKILALLGANGSGKTTTIRTLTTLSAADSGSARVAGNDVAREAQQVRDAIGLTAQETVIDGFLTGGEYLDLIGRLRHIPRPRRRQEAAALLSEFELEDRAHTRVSGYSGGMRRRLDIATSLIGRPEVVFLDEPSSGLDPHSRERMWEAIRSRAQAGTTVLLTTQYMEEADALADSVVVLAKGRVIKRGTPDALKDDIGGRVVELTLAEPVLRDNALAILAGSDAPPLPGGTPEMVGFALLKSSPPLLTILQSLDMEGVEVSDVIVRRPTLDEAFLQLTRKVDGLNGQLSTNGAR